MHVAALVFVGILLLSVSGLLHHKRIGEGFIDDTGIGTTSPHYKAITSTIQKELTNEDQRLQKKANYILQFFLDLLHVIDGDLNTSKIASFTLFHRWTGGKYSLLRIHEYHPKITMFLTQEQLQ
jgi:hypothetical protein